MTGFSLRKVSTINTYPIRTILTALFCMALTLAACGSSDDSVISGEAVATTAPTTTTSTTEPTTTTTEATTTTSTTTTSTTAELEGPFTGTDEIEVGQCFVYPEADEFDGLVTPECDEPHDAQIYHDFDAPEQFDEDEVLGVCEDNFNKITDEALDELSDEARYEFFTIGDPFERVLCIIWDSEGLEGSILVS